MRILAALVASFLVALTATAASAQSVPVMVWAEDDLDPCAWGQVRGLKASGDGFLSVRKGPGSHYGRIDKIHNGQGLFLCDYRDGWHGVIYTKKGTDCKIGRPTSPRPYQGRCWVGWAHENWIVLIAG